MKLRLRGGGDHHGVVDALAVDGLPGIEDARACRDTGQVGLLVLDGAVGVVGDAAELGDAIGKPEAAHAVAVVDAVVGVGMNVVFEEAGKHGGVGSFDHTGDSCGRGGRVGSHTSDAI